MKSIGGLANDPCQPFVHCNSFFFLLTTYVLEKQIEMILSVGGVLKWRHATRVCTHVKELRKGIASINFHFLNESWWSFCDGRGEKSNLRDVILDGPFTNVSFIFQGCRWCRVWLEWKWIHGRKVKKSVLKVIRWGSEYRHSNNRSIKILSAFENRSIQTTEAFEQQKQFKSSIQICSELRCIWSYLANLWTKIHKGYIRAKDW